MNIQHENGDSSQKSAATVFNNAFLKGHSRTSLMEPLYRSVPCIKMDINLKSI